jgi:hypothetical protein
MATTTTITKNVIQAPITTQSPPFMWLSEYTPEVSRPWRMRASGDFPIGYPRPRPRLCVTGGIQFVDRWRARPVALCCETG